MSLPKHGANPHYVYRQLQIEQPGQVFDFSENVNAKGLPPAVLAAWPRLVNTLTHYPDPFGEPFLSAAAAYHDVSKECLFIGNGAAEIFSLLAERYRGKRAVVVHPTFSEYEATLFAKGAQIERIIMNDQLELPVTTILQAMDDADVLYICTPNNPTGILPPAETLQQIIDYGEQVQCEIVLDEAFIDFADERASFIHQTQPRHVIITRSMTKMFAIPGIRLGYVVAHPSIIDVIRAQASHWNVNGLAIEVGTICLTQQAFIEETKQDVSIERNKMIRFLQQYDCVITPSVTNFLCVQLPNPSQTRACYEALLKKGIVLRHTENFLGLEGQWLRIGIKDAEQMERLREEWAQWFTAE